MSKSKKAGLGCRRRAFSPEFKVEAVRLMRERWGSAWHRWDHWCQARRAALR